MNATRQMIHTDRAPSAVGTYSQAIKVGKMVFISGQIPLDPETMQLVSNEIDKQIYRVFDSLEAICHESGGHLDDIVKLTIYLTDLTHYKLVNDIMETYFYSPFPARAAVQVSALPKGSAIEIDAILVLPD